MATGGVSYRTPFALLAEVGEDCAGAVQLFASEPRDRSLSSAVQGLDERQVVARL